MGRQMKWVEVEKHGLTRAAGHWREWMQVEAARRRDEAERKKDRDVYG